MGKPLRDEDLRLNIIVNGDAGRKAIDDLKRSVSDSKTALDALVAKQKELERQGKQLSPEYKQLTAEIDRKSAAHDKETERLKNLIRQQSIEKMTLRELQQHYRATSMAFRNAAPGSEAWQKLRLELQQTDVRIKELKGSAIASGGVIKRMAGGFSRFFGAFTAGFASLSFAVMGINKARTSFLEYDEALTDAQKTTNSTKTEISGISDELKHIDTRTAQNSLLDIVRIAGKLGIEGVENLVEFTRAGDMIGVGLARELGGNVEAAIEQIGKLVDIFHLKETFGIEKSMLKVGSAINELGMASTASEGYIVEFARRAAGTAPNVNVSIQSVLGLGATLDKFGQSAETAGTSYGQVITAMYKRTKVFANIAKMSIGDFRKLMNEDMNEAFIRVLEGMGKSGNGMQSIVNALNSMKLDGQRCVQVLGVLAANTDELRQQQNLANYAFDQGTSIIDEFNIKNTTAEATTKKLKKRITEESVALGRVLTPAYHDSLSVQASLIGATRVLMECLIKSKGVIIGLATVYAIYIGKQKVVNAWKILQTFWSDKHRIALLREVVAINATIAATDTATIATQKATAATTLMSAAQNLLVGNFRAAGIAAKAFFVAIGPLGWIALAAGVVATAWNFVADSTSKASKAQELLSDHMRTAATDAAKERMELDRLKGKLAACEVGTKDYNDTKQEIIEKFGKYDSTLQAETLTVQTLSDKYNSLTRAIMQSAKTRQYNKFVETQQASFDTDFNEITDKLWKNLNDSYYTEKASQYYNQIISAFFGGRSLDAWLTTGSSKAKKLVRELDELRNVQNKADKEAKARFNIKAGPTPNTLTTTPPSGTDPTVTTPFPDEKNKSKKEWSLDNDVAFLTERKKLREKYAAGDEASERLYQDALLNIEITAYKRRIAGNKDLGAAREKIAGQLADKLTEQARLEVQKAEAAEDLRIQNMTDAAEREQAEHERRKVKYAGNTAALEQLEIQHNRRLTKIKLDQALKALKQLEDEYKQQRRIIQEQQTVELSDATLSRIQKTKLRRQHTNDLKNFDADYLKSVLDKIQELNLSGTMSFRDLKGMVQSINLDTNLLSEEEKNDLRRRIQEVITDLKAAEKVVGELGYSFTNKQGDILGFSPDDWILFFENLKAGKFGAEGMAMALGAAANAGQMALDLYSSYDKMMTAKENAEFKRYQKRQDKKKKLNQDRVKSGLMSEEQASAEDERIQAEADAKQEELEIKQAKRQKAMSIVQAIINTALGVSAALSTVPPASYVMAAITAAMGAAQIAMIASTPIAGAEEGGSVVERMQDGRKFKAKYAPDKRGFISSPTVLVSEAGSEYVVPGNGVQNPTLLPLLRTIEAARRQGSLASFDFNAIYRQQPISPGFVSGGLTGPAPTLDTTRSMTPDSISTDSATLRQLSEAVEKLTKKLDDPIRAYTPLLGKNGLKEAMDQLEQNRQHGKLG